MDIRRKPHRNIKEGRKLGERRKGRRGRKKEEDSLEGWV